MSLGDTPYWAHFVRTLRRREGLTQAALARVLSVDQTAVSRWERALDEPGLRLRGKLRTLFRSEGGGRQDRALAYRVRNAGHPTTLMKRGAVFLELNEGGAREAGVECGALRGRSLYGAFGPQTDEVTERWEQTGIFDGDVAMTISVNRLEWPDRESLHIRTLDTPYFTSDGDVWCLTEVKRIDAEMYRGLREQWRGDTMSLGFEG